MPFFTSFVKLFEFIFIYLLFEYTKLASLKFIVYLCYSNHICPWLLQLALMY